MNVCVVKCFTQSTIGLGVSPASSPSDEDSIDLSKVVSDGVNLGLIMLMVAQWPFTLAMSLAGRWISVFTTLISVFNVMAGFVTPGTPSAGLLSWLRGENAKM